MEEHQTCSKLQELESKFNKLAETNFDPLVTLRNGTVTQMTQSQAIESSWHIMYETKENVNALDAQVKTLDGKVQSIDDKLQMLDTRTQVLDDIQKLFTSAREFKKNLMRYLNPFAKGFMRFLKFLAWVFGLYIVIYLIYQLATGKIKLMEFIDKFLNIIF